MSRARHGDVGEVGRGGLHDPPAVPGGHRAPVLGDDQHVEKAAGPGRLLNEVLVSQCHGVAVEHRRAHDPPGRRGPNRLGPPVKPVPPVLHEHRLPGPGHLVEAQGGKLGPVLRLGVEKKPPPPRRQGFLPQGGEQGGRKALPLEGRVHGHALDHIPRQGCGRRDPAPAVPDQGRVLDPRRKAQPRAGQKCLQLLQDPPRRGAGHLQTVSVLHSASSIAPRNEI